MASQLVVFAEVLFQQVVAFFAAITDFVCCNYQLVFNFAITRGCQNIVVGLGTADMAAKYCGYDYLRGRVALLILHT